MPPLPWRPLGGFNGLNASVTRVTHHAAGIINPITANCRILAAGGMTGRPIVSSTHPEWIAEWMLSCALYPLPLSLSSSLSYFFPTHVQVRPTHPRGAGISLDLT